MDASVPSHRLGDQPRSIASGRTTLCSLLALLVLLWACGPVRLVSSYDEILDRGTSDLNTKIVSFVTRMVTLSGKPEGTYDSNATFYDDVTGSIATLRLRAQVRS